MPRHWKVFYLTTVVFICSGGEYFELYSYSSWNLCSLVIYVHISSIFGLGGRVGFCWISYMFFCIPLYGLLHFEMGSIEY